jgi:2-keto-4-pentenoate hydratase/2-oxohepta-3-ene-1,7-dioic acid hydratase in catechol pathway
MRMVTFTHPEHGVRIGVMSGSGLIIDLLQASKDLNLKPPCEMADMVDVIAAGSLALDWIRGVAGRASGHYKLHDVELQAPINRPRKNIFCVGWNYVEHFEEGAASRSHQPEMPTHPTFFTKAPTTANGPYSDVPSHAGLTDQLDWEAELALVIGETGKNIRLADAMNHVFGYTIANDVSGREIQRRHGQQWFKGKSLDGSCPMGPWITTKDEIADPQSLDISCKVNGSIKQQSNTKHMYFKIPQIIEQLSAGLTLEAGDVILTGTPAGVGHARKPPEFLHVGDILETSIEQLGSLRNMIAEG